MKADNEVTVYGLSRDRYSTDAFLSLPIDALGFEYITMNYDTPVGFPGVPSQVAIVGVYDNTKVSIIPSVNTGEHIADQPFTIELNSSETFLMTSEGRDLTGSIITSSSPVAVLSGVLCANIPANVYYCDYIVEMMPPVSTWGQSFVTVPLATRLRGDIFRVLASQDETSVLINGVETAVLNRGEFYETFLTEQSQIETSHPVLVAQYSVGQEHDGVISDPFMMLVPPSEQFLDDYSFSTSIESGFNNSFVNVVVPTESINTIILDDAPVDIALFTAIADSGFSGAQIQIGSGSHTINSTVPFGIYVYGFGNYDSYGYPGGMAFDFINPLGDSYFPNVKLMPIDDVIQGMASDNEDLNINGILDADEDINNNGLIDRRTEDQNGNGLLDEGEDTNGNGVLDRDTGLFRIELESGYENLLLQVDNFVPGALQAEFTLSLIDPDKPGIGVLNIIDGSGNKVSKTIDLSNKQRLTNAWVISTLSTTDIDLDNSSFTVTPDKITVLAGQTLIEWRFSSILIDQIENLNYQIVLRNPVPGETRLITQQLDLYYTDINGNAVHSGLGDQSVNVLSSVFQVEVDTDKPSYTAEENVLISSQINNLSQYPQVVDVKTSVQDSNGNLVEDFGIVQDITIDAGQTWQHPDLTFATGTTYQGLYQVHTQLLDQNGSEIALALASFVITTPSDTKVSGTISTDKAEYLAFDSVNVLSRIQNITPNALLEGYTATTTLYNPNNENFWSETTALPQLLPDSSKDLNASVTLNAALAGNYRAELIIKDQDGIERSLSETQFIVQSSAITGSGLTGSISVTPKPVLKTEFLTLNANVNNIGNSDLTNLPITVSIIDPATESIVAEWTQTLPNLAIQQQFAIQNEWQAQAIVGSTYVAVLSAQISGQTKYLDRASFVIAEKIVNQQMISGAGRVLILLDPLHEEDDDDGATGGDDTSTTTTGDDGLDSVEHNALIAQQRLYLETLLQENDWSYTIVTDEDSFARELRSHAYTQYALFATDVELDEQVVEELREAVFNGNGLLHAGEFELDDDLLEKVLGVVVGEQHETVTGLEMIDSVWPLTGQTDWHPNDQALEIILQNGVQAVARYLGLLADNDDDDSNGDHSVAITRHSYGDGRTVFMGFNVLAHGSVAGADPFFNELLLTALQETTPAVKTVYTAGDPIAIQLTQTNQGIATTVQTTVTLPAGTEVLDSRDAQIAADGTLVWISELAENQSDEITLWLRLPVDVVELTTATIQIQIQVGEAGNWQAYDSHELQIPVQPGRSYADILAELQGLTPADDYESVIEDITEANLAEQQGNYQQALSELIEATDDLIDLQTPQAVSLRHQLYNLITRAGRNIQAI